MFVNLPNAEATISQLINEGRYNDALANIFAEVFNSYSALEWKHRYLYYSKFDQQLQQLSNVIEVDRKKVSFANNGTLIIATHLYETGGHSRVIEDIVREVKTPTIVLTDIWWRYRKAPDLLDWIFDINPQVSIIVLLQNTLWGKCRELRNLTQRLSPRNILYFQHHYDPIAFIGTLGHYGSHKTIFHHCDHNPSLGNTINGLEHVDFTTEMAATCSTCLKRDAKILPLYVTDTNRKNFEPVHPNLFSVVTSGTSNKFARTGPFALQAIVETVLSTLQGDFFHIGPIDAEWLIEIKSYLVSKNIEPTRFATLGTVSSLWVALAGLDAHLYLGSAPVGGGRAAIEAQGCGYPVAFFRVNNQGTALGTESIYASKEIGWSTLDELSAMLKTVAPKLPSLSQKARENYELNFSREKFMQVLGGIMAFNLPMENKSPSAHLA